MGITEMLFVYLLKSTGNWNKTEWEEYSNFKANPIETDGVTIKAETK